MAHSNTGWRSKHTPDVQSSNPLPPSEESSPLADVLAALPDPVFLCTAEGDVVYENRQARAMTGYSDDECAEMNVAEAVPKSLRSVVQDKLGKVVDTGSARLVVPVLTQKGPPVLYEITGSLVTWEGNELICGIARDISQHKAREDELRRQKEQFRLLVEEVEAYAIFMLDREGHVMTWNAGAEKIKGYTEAEILGKHFSIFYPEEALEAGKTEKALEVATRDGQWIDEGWRLRKDGSRFWASVTLTALHEEDGSLRGFAKVTFDMTKRRTQEKTLRKSERRYRRLFEASQEGISIITPKGEILDANPAALEMFGYSRTDLSGLNVAQLSADAAEWKDIVESLRRQGHLRRREVRFRTAGGEEMICEMSVTVHHEVKGRPVAYQCFIREITDRKRVEKALKESEEKFRALAEQSLIGIELIQDGVYEYVNPTFAGYFGYSQEELIGRSPEVIFHPADWPMVKKKIRRRLSGEKEEAKFRARGRAKSGETLYLEMYGRRVEYQGRPALVGATLDMTEQRQLQRDALRAQEEERRKFGRDLHDGVASQLTGIRLHLGTAKQMLDEDHPAHRQVEKAIALADESGEDVRRLSRGLNPICLEDRELSTALKGLSKNTQSCCFEREGDPPPLSEEQKTQLYWIAQEAVTNARKYAEADEISIRLRSTNNGVDLIVEDDGQGFEPSAESDGLGLRSMKYRAELLGGTFTLSSEPGAGTRIECRVQPHRY